MLGRGAERQISGGRNGGAACGEKTISITANGYKLASHKEWFADRLQGLEVLGSASHFSRNFRSSSSRKA